jgi:tRNA-uridine 2-sulfurtransferase
VTGITMKIWEGEPGTGEKPHHGCYGPEEAADIDDARRVAAKLDIPYRVIDLTREYKKEVLDYLRSVYLSGKTPNPCVRCNHKIKFGAFIEKALEAGLDSDYMASGHYARIQFDQNSNRFLLKKALDFSKDQSYFLSALSQKQLKRLLFPLGEYTKVEVRKMAERLGLSVAGKADSQNFISGDYCDVIKTEEKPGPIVDQQDHILGSHRGIQHYTLGQRKGLGVSAANLLYVIAIDPVQNTITVGDRPDLFQREFIVANLNWIAFSELLKPRVFSVKIRSSHPESLAEVIPLENGECRVVFQQPQMAITPGQAAVFYDSDVVAGVGIIQSVIHDIKDRYFTSLQK